MIGISLRFILSVAITLTLDCGYAYGAQTFLKDKTEEACHLDRQRLGFRVFAINAVRNLESKQPSNEELVAIFKGAIAKIPALIETSKMPGYSKDETELKIYADFHEQHPCAKLFAMELALNISNLPNFKKTCEDILLAKDVPLAILQFLRQAKINFNCIFEEDNNRPDSPEQDKYASQTRKEKDIKAMTTEQSLIIEDIQKAVWFAINADGLIKEGKKVKIEGLIDNGYLQEKAGSIAYRLGQLMKANLDTLSAVAEELQNVLKSPHPIDELESYLGKKNV